MHFCRFGAASFWLVATVASCDPGLSDLSNGGPVPSTTSAEAGAGDGGSKGDGGAGVDGSSGGPGTDGGGACDSTDGGPHDIGSSCRQPTDCCSAACSESHRCAAMCLPEGASDCDPQASTCCTGAYCSVTAGTQCKACIETGSAPELVNGVANERSCCSRHASTPFGGGPVKCSNDSG